MDGCRWQNTRRAVLANASDVLVSRIIRCYKIILIYSLNLTLNSTRSCVVTNIYEIHDLMQLFCSQNFLEANLDENIFS